MSQTAPHVTTASAKKKRRAVVTGDSLLRGTEGPICRPDPSHREVCCLPGARVMDVAGKLSDLVWPSGYYPLLVMQVGRDEIVDRSLSLCMLGTASIVRSSTIVMTRLNAYG